MRDDSASTDLVTRVQNGDKQAWTRWWSGTRR